MRILTIKAIVLAMLLNPGAGDPASSVDSPAHDAGTIEGIWQGVVSYPGLDLRVVFKISRTSEGCLAAVMIQPDQGDHESPVSSLTFVDDRLHLKLPAAGTSFEGRLACDGSTIEGRWERGDVSLPLVLHRVTEISKPHRPQTPTPPYPYEVLEVAYVNPLAPARLAGTVTLPREPPPYPAVILISGGGAQDRDNTILGHRPFLVMADHLTRRGIAVLRVDDRGVGSSTGDRSSATSADYADDALAGVAFLKTLANVDPRRIGLIGHSEGGIIAPLAAARSKDVAFVILLAAPGLPGQRYFDQYDESLGRSLGLPAETITRTRELHRRIYAVLKAEPDRDRAEQRLRVLFSEFHPDMPEQRVQVSLDRYLRPWYRFILSHDPSETLARLTCPVLAIFGEKDVQVPPEGNADAVRRAMAASGNADSRVEVLPNLNHFFQAATTGAPSEYGEIEQTIDPAVLDLIATWILDR
ncbi:MAG: alpha/beta hydrolase [Phycisphaerales bacterium]|nr:MAG: alpha/beta hydrolase [Phycisphaerales bacterium]